MAKFRSILVEEESLLPNGKVKPGVVAWEPLDDAAKAMPVVEKAIAAGVYKPAPGETPKEMAEKLYRKELELARRQKPAR